MTETPAPQTFSIGGALDEGAAYAMAGNHKSACAFFRGVLVHEPNNYEAINRLGSSLFELQQFHEALYYFWRGKKLEPKHPLALTNYGLTLTQLGHCDEAVGWLERAVAIAEKKGWHGDTMALLYNNLGNTYERLKRHKDALEILDKGIGENPNDPFPYYNRGIALMRLNRHRDAIESLNRSISLRHQIPDGSGSRLSEPDALYNRGMAHLLLGNFKDGWDGYEARLLTSENPCPNLGLPAERKWNGEDLNDKWLLVHAEQGLGDTLQFLRFVPLLAERGAHVKLVTHREIWPVLGDMHRRVVLLRPGEELPTYHYWVALMSLPLMLGIDSEEKLKDYPPRRPIYTADRVARWARDMALDPTNLNVGVCWAGNFQHKNDAHRSIPLKQFAQLFDTPGVNFVSLQQMSVEDSNAFPELTRGKNVRAIFLDDFRDTAAIIDTLDLVVTVDTALAHFAASMGKPTYILLPAYNTDWRWQLGRRDSPWYPAATLYRQPRIGDWDAVLKQIASDLRAQNGPTALAVA